MLVSQLVAPDKAPPFGDRRATLYGRPMIFAVFFAIGLGIGFAADAVTGKTGLGIALGVAFGVALGACVDGMRRGILWKRDRP